MAFAAPPLIRSGPIEPELLAQRLRQLCLTAQDVVASSWIDNGPGWIGLHPPGAECGIEVRGLFADAAGLVREDPVAVSGVIGV